MHFPRKREKRRLRPQAHHHFLPFFAHVILVRLPVSLLLPADLVCENEVLAADEYYTILKKLRAAAIVPKRNKTRHTEMVCDKTKNALFVFCVLTVAHNQFLFHLLCFSVSSSFLFVFILFSTQPTASWETYHLKNRHKRPITLYQSQ